MTASTGPLMEPIAGIKTPPIFPTSPTIPPASFPPILMMLVTAPDTFPIPPIRAPPTWMMDPMPDDTFPKNINTGPAATIKAPTVIITFFVSPSNAENQSLNLLTFSETFSIMGANVSINVIPRSRPVIFKLFHAFLNLSPDVFNFSYAVCVAPVAFPISESL